jgi:hypothetical protein
VATIIPSIKKRKETMLDDMKDRVIALVVFVAMVLIGIFA